MSIETRLCNLFGNSKNFDEASKQYQNFLNQSGYNYKLQYKPSNNENENRSKLPKNCKAYIISKNVSNNIGTYFLLLIQKHFPNNHKSTKIM